MKDFMMLLACMTPISVLVEQMEEAIQEYKISGKPDKMYAIASVFAAKAIVGDDPNKAFEAIKDMQGVEDALKVVKPKMEIN